MNFIVKVHVEQNIYLVLQRLDPLPSLGLKYMKGSYGLIQFCLIIQEYIINWHLSPDNTHPSLVLNSRQNELDRVT